MARAGERFASAHAALQAPGSWPSAIFIGVRTIMIDDQPRHRLTISNSNTSRKEKNRAPVLLNVEQF
jgi:hypothetical protein